MSKTFSMVEYFKQVAEQWQPELGFTKDNVADFANWHSQALNKLKALLGAFPPQVPLNPQVIYSVEDGDVIRQRVILDVDEYMAMPCLIVMPQGLSPNHKAPAILCSHGHGPYGKEPVAGVRTTGDRRNNIEEHNYDYGLQMARRGYVCICPDLRNFGERSDGGAPYPGRDICNVNFIRGMILGLYTLTLNISDMMRAIDYLQTMPEVDPDRIGMMGLSQGGTMTTFTTAVEPRIKAADIMGYVNSWKAFGIGTANFCGSQIVPDIYKYLDVPDIAGLITPRPLLIEMGAFDKCFSIDDLKPGYEHVKKIYEAAGVADKLWCDLHPGPHAFAGNKAFDFFETYL
jgi:hypothetical protein